MEYRHLPIFCLLGAWALVVIGLVIGIVWQDHWFARFGSLVVLVALIGEFSMLRAELRLLYDRLGNTDDDFVHARDFTPSRWQSKKSLLLHLTVVAGTLIWGFGDLVI